MVNKISHLFEVALILLLCVYSLKVNGQTNSSITIKDISDSNYDQNDNMYIKYPYTSSQITCNYRFKFLVSTSLQLSTDLTFSSNGTLSLSFYSIMKNDTSNVFQVNLQYVNFGAYYVNITGYVISNTSISETITINIECQEVIIQDLQYEILGVVSNSNLSPFNYLGYFKLNGLKNSLALDMVNVYGVQPARLFQNYYEAGLRVELILNTLTVGWVTQVQFPNSVFEIKFPPCFKSDFNIPFNFKLYPSEDSIGLFTPNCEVGCNQLFTFNLNASNDGDYGYKPFILAIPPNIISNSDIPVPPKLIQSINGVNTYLSVLPFRNQSVPIYSQNGTDTITFKTAVTSVGQKFTLFDSFIGSSIVSNYEQSNQLNVVTVKMQNCTNYSFSEILILVDILNSAHQFPFGFSSGNNTLFKTDISIISNLNSYLPKYQFKISSYGTSGYLTQLSPFNYIQDTNYTVVSSFKAEIMENVNKVMFTVEFKDVYGVSYAELITYSGNRYGSDSLVSGSLTDGIFEMILDLNSNILRAYPFLTFTNKIGIRQTYNFEAPISIQDPTSIYTIPYYFSQLPFNGLSIVNISFAKNNLDVTNNTIGNTITFNITNIDNVYRPISFKILDSSITIDPSKYYSKTPIKWNEVIKLFQVDFFIMANSPIGIVPYLIQYSETCSFESNSLPLSHQLVISKSDNVDTRGPIFTNIQKNSNLPNWIVTIEDMVNGFDHGYILVSGSLDNSLFNFSLSPYDNSLISGNKYSGNYELLIKVENSPNNCISQTYYIERVHLVDTYGLISHYSKHYNSDDFNNGYLSSPQLNPFINYLNESTITSIQYICQSGQVELELGGTTLLYFTASKSSMDLGLSDRNISFEFQVQDINVGLKPSQRPIVYLTNTNLETAVQCVSSIIEINSTHAKYSCSTKVPIAFGYSNGGFIISVYGFINRASQYVGFSSKDLRDLGQSYYVNSTQLSFDQPIITGTSEISTRGGSIWVYGRSLKDQSFSVIYSDGIHSVTSITQIKIYHTAVLLSGIRQTLSSFIITVGNIKTDQYIVKPVNYDIGSIPIIPTPSPTITPTNAPQACIGTPKCGGPDRGICKESGCVCISPWIGNDCLSKVIIVPPPKINTTDPTVIIPITPPSSNSTSSSSHSEESEVFYKSLISLVALRELDFNNQPKKTHIFKQWIFTPINESISTYFTNITNTNELGAEVITNITTTLQWFTENTNITFADIPLVMNPSTIKFTIGISSYPFSSNLNRLQLVMAASFESTQLDACSQTQFGNTSSGDNSNFIKLNIDDHSLYGRFIKRAIVDKIPKTIDNILLDPSLNPIDNSNVQTKSSIQSFIGINIPNFEILVTVDPDFSVLLSEDNSNLNSQCNSNSGLSASKIAGIVIGSFAFTAIVLTVIVYSIYKKRQDQNVIKSISLKMKEMN